MEAEKPDTAAAPVSADADAVSKSSVTIQPTADGQEPTPGAGADESPSKGADNGWAAYWVSFCSFFLFSPLLPAGKRGRKKKEGEKRREK